MFKIIIFYFSKTAKVTRMYKIPFVHPFTLIEIN